ncbi:hypothetical protein Bca4012_077841 [Brassica carinata]|uniref:(rape) hypothetical protein n=1 Tax=Brassica napus TaxID=3708 RepID=A0A816MTA8_BRANA|nr:hypothetical protein HID58_076066 [Brassica napus]CAF1989153.1 unnamed protein product [Brassica napus]
MSEAKVEERVCEDRISELPDDLIVAILSLIPTKDAVATMFMSKRWLSIWTMVPVLDYKDEKEGRNSVWSFLHKSLQYHKAPLVDTLAVLLGSQCPTDVDVGKCVANVVDRRVREIIFELVWSADPTRLPNSLYSCESLRELSLSHKILVDFPYSSCLPSLKKLELSSVVYKDDDSLRRFLSISCPTLKALFVTRKKDDNLKTLTVKVPSLWCLLYHNCFMNNDVEEEDNGRCLVIDTPALEEFHVMDISRDYCSTNHMPCLKGAYLSSNSCPGEKLLRSFSSVLSLELCLNHETLVCCSTVNFSRLVKLIIDPEDSDWLEPLMLLLGNAPKLRNLTVDDAYRDRYEDVLLTWNQPNYVPGCLSSTLEIFEWIEYEDGEEEEEFLTYILAHSKHLKTATISLRPSYDLQEQGLIIEELKDIPRVSTASQLLFR